jgi:hypothetical protein
MTGSSTSRSRRRNPVPALALALLAGLRGTTHGRRALFVLPAAWLLGGVIGLTVRVGVSPIPT